MVVNAVLELGIIIGIAAVLALVARLVKQPPLVAYLLTGILIGPLAFNLLKSTDLIQTFAHIGIALLLFIIGLSLDFKVFKEVGVVASITGIIEIVIVSGISFLIAIGFGLGYAPALYISVALAFSSAVVVVKSISDKKESDTLHGKIALGIIIIEHVIAAFFLMIMPSQSGSISAILMQIGKALLLTVALFFVARVLIYRIFSMSARNHEILFLLSISWALLIAMLFDAFGFSLEIGALLAGMALAQSPYSVEMTGKLKGLRDFFVVLFFVFFGSQLASSISPQIIKQVIIFSVLILLGKPLIIMSCMKIFGGYTKKTNFFTAISLAQISEISLIIALVGFNQGVLSTELMSMIILIALTTIILSSYSIHYSPSLFRRLSKYLNIFNGNRKEISNMEKKNYEIILFGYNRIGFSLAKAFNKASKSFLVVDYNPNTISSLTKKGIHCIYGDADDPDLLEEIPIQNAKIIISTIPHVEVNLMLASILRGKNIIFIPTSHNIEDTKALYKSGADYVIMPHFLGGDYMAHILIRDNFNKLLLQKEGKKHLEELYERAKEGHTHPSKDFHGH